MFITDTLLFYMYILLIVVILEPQFVQAFNIA